MRFPESNNVARNRVQHPVESRRISNVCTRGQNSDIRLQLVDMLREGLPTIHMPQAFPNQRVTRSKPDVSLAT